MRPIPNDVSTWTIEDYERWFIGGWNTNGAHTGLDRPTEPTERDMMIAALGLAGEAGEAVDLIKKSYRDGTPIDKRKLGRELGDAFAYIVANCWVHGLTIRELMEMNVDKLEFRRMFGKEADESRFG